MTGCEGYRAIARVYDRLNAELDYSAWADFIEAAFDRFLPQKPELVLDLACGTGSLSVLLAQRGHRVIGADLSEDMLAEELYNDNASFIVAVADDGTVLGYAGLTVVLDEGYINNVAVRSQYRRMGVADALLGTFINFAEDHLAFLTLEVRASNDKAISLYTKNGFVQEGRRKDYYKDPKEDAIIMTRRFSGEEA